MSSYSSPPPSGRRRQMHLNAFLMNTGHHEASWRLPGSDPFASLRVDHYKHLARTAETGCMDSVFFADSPSIWGPVSRRPSGHRTGHPSHRHCRRHRAQRTHHHGFHILQLSLQPGPPLCFSRLPERGEGRMEHSHHGEPRRRPQLRFACPRTSRGALPKGDRVRGRGAEALG